MKLQIPRDYGVLSLPIYEGMRDHKYGIPGFASKLRVLVNIIGIATEKIINR